MQNDKHNECSQSWLPLYKFSDMTSAPKKQSYALRCQLPCHHHHTFLNKTVSPLAVTKQQLLNNCHLKEMLEENVSACSSSYMCSPPWPMPTTAALCSQSSAPSCKGCCSTPGLDPNPNPGPWYTGNNGLLVDSPAQLKLWLWQILVPDVTYPHDLPHGVCRMPMWPTHWPSRMPPQYLLSRSCTIQDDLPHSMIHV